MIFKPSLFWLLMFCMRGLYPRDIAKNAFTRISQ